MQRPFRPAPSPNHPSTAPTPQPTIHHPRSTPTNSTTRTARRPNNNRERRTPTMTGVRLCSATHGEMVGGRPLWVAFFWVVSTCECGRNSVMAVIATLCKALNCEKAWAEHVSPHSLPRPPQPPPPQPPTPFSGPGLLRGGQNLVVALSKIVRCGLILCLGQGSTWERA